MAAGRMLTSMPSETLPLRGNEVWIKHRVHAGARY